MVCASMMFTHKYYSICIYIYRYIVYKYKYTHTKTQNYYVVILTILT